MMVRFISLSLLIFIQMYVVAQQVSTLTNEPCGDDLAYYSGFIYSTNYGGNSIRKISLDGKIDKILSGYEKLGAIEIDREGTIYATNYDGGLLMRANLAEKKMETILEGLKGPAGITKDRMGNLFINQNAAGIITKFNPASQRSDALYQGQPLFWNTAITVDPDDNIYSNNMWTGEIIKINQRGEHALVAELPAIMDNQPDLGYMEFVNGQLLVLHQNNDCIYSIDPASGFYSVLAGKEGEEGHTDGLLSEATFDDPIGIVFNKEKNELYVTDGKEGAQRLRVVELGDGLRYLPDFSKNPLTFENNVRKEDSSVTFKFVLTTAAEVTFEVLDAQYEPVQSEIKNLEEGKRDYSLDITDYKHGLYFINVKCSGFVKTFKIQIP